MSICPFPILNKVCPRCNHEFKYNTFRWDNKSECPECSLPFIVTNYVDGMFISVWGTFIWAKECDDGKWRIPKGKFLFDKKEQKKWGVK